MLFYFMGIGGVAMGNAALLLRRQGHTIIGSDKNIYPPMSNALKDAGILFYEGYDPERLKQLSPDYVIVGNVIARGNPEMEFLLDTRRFPYTSLPAFLAEHILAHRHNIVITGTHGKTTTTALTAYLLKANGFDPGYFIGGVPRDLPGGAFEGDKGSPFVIEGDEYDTAFFDKRSKFIHYRPNTLVINNVEFDHSDIFRDIKDIKRTFNHLLRIVPRSGQAIFNVDDLEVQSLEFVSSYATWGVGTKKNARVRISDFHETPEQASFNLFLDNKLWDKITWPLSGLYNARNAAMAATAAAIAVYPNAPGRFSLKALKTFQGVNCRQQCVFKNDTLTVIKDFAHHPSAVEQTLKALKQRYPEHLLTAVFEPRSNTARSAVFQNDFALSLQAAERVFLGPVYHGESLSEKNRLDTNALAKVLSTQGVTAAAFAHTEDLLHNLCQKIRDISLQQDVLQLVVFLTNGDFDGLVDKFIDHLNNR